MTEKRGPLHKWVVSHGARRKVLTPEGRKQEATVQQPSLEVGVYGKKSPLRRMEAAVRTTYRAQVDAPRVGKSPMQYRRD